MGNKKMSCCQQCRLDHIKDNKVRCSELVSNMTMLICGECGNKRCPKAQDHHFKCTNSNEPNQKDCY